MAIAGHVSREMLEHYSHIRMEAKGAALNGTVQSVTVEAELYQDVHQPESPQIGGALNR